MPIRDRLSSLKKKSIVDNGEVMVMSSLISEMEQQSTDEFLRRASGLREAIGEMNSALDLIRQLHKLLKVSTENPDRARLRLLFHELSRVFKQFSDDLDEVVKAVNGLHDEVRSCTEQKSAHYRMRKDQTDSLRTLLHSVILRFREEEVPFEQETKPATEKQLQEFQMKPSTGLAAEQAQNQVHENEPRDKPLSRGNEIGDVEKAMQTASTNAVADTTSQSSLQCVEVDEEVRRRLSLRCSLQKGESDEKAVLLEVKQRNEDLLLLEKAVSMLNSLHEHLNFLVHTQDATLNRIDVNISQAAEYTEKVMNDTSQARKLNEEAREKRILVFFLLGLLLFILIVTLITFIRVWVFGLQ